ncbi:MAG: SLC26A/SulP transporter family protein [Acetobacteraceae bacterium]|nr:SLC26A/SulP transporter family protein [Acetobacteraceae bacterium]
MPGPGDAASGPRNEIAAGVGTGIVVSAQALTHGMIAFAPLGPAAAGFGLAAALAASVAAGLAATLFAASRPLIGTTTAATALVTAGMLAAAQPATAQAGVLLAMLLAVLAGALMLLLLAARLAPLATLIPAPVTVGMLNAIVVLVLLGQAPVAAGQPPGVGWQSDGLQPASLAVAGLAVLLMRRPVPLLPAPVAALAGACALHHLLAALGVGLGPVVGAAPTLARLAEGLHSAVAAAGQLPPAGDLTALLLPAALPLAILASVEGATAGAALRERSGRPGRPGRDLLACATGMLAGGLAGGAPATGLSSATLTCHRLGGRGRLAMALRAGVTALVLIAAGPLVAPLPYAALAGLLAGAVLPLFQGRMLWPGGGPHRARHLSDALVVATVTVTGAVLGLVAAVAAGVALSMVIFVVAMSRATIRRTIQNPTGRSRMRRPAGDATLLRNQGGRIVLVELEGAIFFGSAERIVTHAGRLRTGGAEMVILDLGRVTRIDMSGGLRLLELCRGAPGALLLAPLHPGARALAELESLGLAARLPAGTGFPSIAAAVEVAEDRLLADSRGTAHGDAMDGSAALAALGLPGAVHADVLSRMTPCAFGTGAAILRQGEAADRAFLLLQGDVVISIADASGREPTRLAVLAPGVLFGEAALLGGGRRSADATARGDVRCLRLTAADAEALRRQAPVAAWHLLEAVARQLAANLAVANRTLDQLEGDDGIRPGD